MKELKIIDDQIQIEDKFGFLQGINGWCNHRVLLLLALELTDGNVMELGCGDGSSNFLHNYCTDKKRLLLSFDNSEEWVAQFRGLDSPLHIVEAVENNEWDKINIKDYKFSVIFFDHAPGERRWVDIERMKDSADILIAHDSEVLGSGNYMYDKIYHLFKYKLDFRSNGAWATAMSNTIDITQYADKKVGDFKISKFDRSEFGCDSEGRFID